MDINYASSMSTVKPGTFVPDISPLPKVEPLPEESTDSGGSFKDTVKALLNNVNDQMVTAEQKSTDLALGKSNDTEGTVKSLEEAGLSMQFTMAVRNKLMDAYQEVNRMTF